MSRLEKQEVAVWLEEGLLRIGRDTPRPVEPGVFSPHSEYVARFWTPVIGPASVALCRWVCYVIDPGPEGARLVPADELGEALGRMSRVRQVDVLFRAVQFRRASVDHGTLIFRSTWPVVPAHQVARLSPATQRLHDRIVIEGGLG